RVSDACLPGGLTEYSRAPLRGRQVGWRRAASDLLQNNHTAAYSHAAVCAGDTVHWRDADVRPVVCYDEWRTGRRVAHRPDLPVSDGVGVLPPGLRFGNGGIARRDHDRRDADPVRAAAQPSGILGGA